MAPLDDPFDDIDPLFGDDLFAEWESGAFDDDIDRPEPGEGERLARLARALSRGGDVQLLDPPVSLQRRVLEAVRADDDAPEQAPSGDAPHAPVVGIERARERRARAGRPLWARPWLAAAAVFVLVAAAVLGLRPGNTKGDVVFAATLSPVPESAAQNASGVAEVVRKGDRLIMRLEAEGLPPTRAGEVYQCWFVGPNDTDTVQDRFAVGTFTTETGDIEIEWEAALDLAKYPKVGITLEPDDGDPRRNGPKVLVGTPTQP